TNSQAESQAPRLGCPHAWGRLLPALRSGVRRRAARPLSRPRGLRREDAACVRASTSRLPARGESAPEEALEVLDSLGFVERLRELRDDQPHVREVDLVC